MRTFRNYLVAMVLAVVLPAMMFGAATIWWIGAELRRDQEKEAVRLVDGIAGDVTAHLQLLTTAMQVLGRSPGIRDGHFAVAHGYAVQLANDFNHHIGLAQPDGTQIFNTRRSYGEELPRRSDPTSYTRALQTDKPSVSNVIIGAIAQKPLITIDIPVTGPSGPLVLGTSSDVKSIAAILERTKLPEGWLGSVVDSKGILIARSLGQEAYAGKAARPEVIAAVTSHQNAGMFRSYTHEGLGAVVFFRKVPGTGWTALIGIPDKLYVLPQDPLTVLAAGATTTMGLTILLAFSMGRRLNRAACQLTDAIRALGRGETPPRVDGFAEISEISTVAQQVAEQLAERDLRIAAEMRERTSSEERLRLFTEVVPAGIAMFDRDMRYLAVSRRYATDYGIPWETIVNRSHYDVFPEIPERWKDIHRRCLAGATERCDEDPFPRADGSLDWVAWEIRPWYEASGEVGGIVLASEVITWRKQVERELRAARDAAELAAASKARFFAAASHDLRQPLQAQRLFLDVLRPSLTPQQMHIFRNIDKAQATVADLLGALLDMAKLDAGTLSPELTALQTGEVAAAIASECRPKAEEKGLHLRLKVTAATVVSDRLMLERILRNLLTNAIRYTETGGVLLAARQRGSRIRFEVWDTGIGIPQDRLELIWEEFFQVDNSARDRSQGLGLGLSIVERLTRILGHAAGVRSQPGKGSVFWVDVPCATAESPSIDGGHVVLAD